MEVIVDFADDSEIDIHKALIEQSFLTPRPDEGIVTWQCKRATMIL